MRHEAKDLVQRYWNDVREQPTVRVGMVRVCIKYDNDGPIVLFNSDLGINSARVETMQRLTADMVNALEIAQDATQLLRQTEK